ncbi:MAG: diguanylate cyclase, partial [Comamonadaceae bacterium]
GMHYTGMAAARFPVGSICGAALDGGVSSHWLASLVGTSTFAILGIAVIVSVLDQRLQERTSLLSDSLHRANAELSYLALHDPLTRLPNRALLEDRLSLAIQKATRHRSRFALMFFDLDGFKIINDAYGHPVGDRLLVQIADGIRGAVRAEDTVARLGGDEFVVLTEVVEPEDAASVAEKLLAQASLPVEIPEGAVRVSASIGIALYPDDASDARELMANADAAMYTAKEHGRNAYRFFEPAMNEGAHVSVALAQALRGAVSRNELSLDFQPKLRMPEGTLEGVEALLRWQHPSFGLVMPGRFIPLAEKHGLIIEIGRWVLEEACCQLAAWRVQGEVAEFGISAMQRIAQQRRAFLQA